MSGVSRLDRAVPFPEFAPDHLLRFSTADLIALSSLLTGTDPGDCSPEALDRRMQRPWLACAEQALDQQDVAFLREAVRLGVRKPGGFERPELDADSLDDLPLAPAAAVRSIADALLCAVSGRAYADVLAERQAGAAEAAKSA